MNISELNLAAEIMQESFAFLILVAGRLRENQFICRDQRKRVFHNMAPLSKVSLTVFCFYSLFRHRERVGENRTRPS